MEELLLTVSMPNYNHGHYLKDRVPSLLAAMPANSELLIVDDGSSDNSVEILDHYAAIDSRLKLVKLKKNMGVNHALNIILENTKGKYISFQSADDAILPDFFTKILAVAEKYPDAGICCSDCGLTFEEGWPDKNPGEIYTTHLLKGETNIRYFPSPEIAKTFRTTTFWIPGHASIIKMKAISSRGGFNAKMGPHSDWFLFHTIALEEGVAYLPETLSIWHQSSNAYSIALPSEEKKAIYREFFMALTEKKNRKLRSLFRQSTLLYFYARQLFGELIWKPQYWDIVLPIVFRALKIKILLFFHRFSPVKSPKIA